MTRETKIGLLVGLVFIIVVGVLLSDHLVNATDPKPAAIADVGSQVLKSMRNPGGANANNISPEKPINVAPQESVSTHSEIARAEAPAHTEIVVGPAPTPAPVVIADAQANGIVPTVRRLTVDPTVGSPVVLDDGSSANPVVVSPPAPAPIVAVPSPVVAPEPPAVAAAPKSQEYKAQAGDTVAKMARKFYGSDTKANRDLIINANVPLKADPRKIVIGKSYTIPAKPGSEAASASAVAGTTATNPAGAAAAPAAPAASAGAGERIYTVKSGDNIWKIAKEQLKNSNSADQIRKLNRDVLKNGDNLKIGMQLKLPAKAD